MSEVTIALSADAQSEKAKDSRFDPDALRTAIEDDLRSRGLFNVGTPSGDTRKLQVLVDSCAIRRMTNAVVMGQIISSAKLTARVTVSDASGHELQSYRTIASTKLSRAADSPKDDNLQPLYRQVATLAVNDLEGAPPKPVGPSSPNTDIPR